MSETTKSCQINFEMVDRGSEEFALVADEIRRLFPRLMEISVLAKTCVAMFTPGAVSFITITKNDEEIK